VPVSAISSLTRAEQVIYDRLIARGYRILRNGWPDFLAIATNGTIYGVEVKRHLADRLRPEQEQMHRLLAAVGVETVVAYADTHRMCECNFVPCWRRDPNKPTPAQRDRRRAT
jgi:hypothetical protein